jgi:hypothetical protein
MLYALILACEAAFWLFLFAGLACRYLLHSKRLGATFLLCVPLVDLLLLVFTAYDLAQGRPATFGHGLATLYLGFTIAFGSNLVAWADARFARRFSAAATPNTVTTNELRYELALWLRCLGALAISCLLLLLLEALLPPTSSPKILRAFYAINASIALCWLLFGPLYTLLAATLRRAHNTQRLR